MNSDGTCSSSPKIENEEIDALLHTKRVALDASNLEEFIDTVEGPHKSARCSTKQIDRAVHIRSTAVDNQDGPLIRSIVSSTSGKLVSPHGSVNLAVINDRIHFDGLEERVRNVETHMSIVVAPIDKSLVERVKILEEKILKIEEFYPQIAAHVFNYGKAEAEASSRPGGRVSRIPGQNIIKRPIDEDQYNVKDGEEHIDDSSLNELKRRMNEVRQRLLKQTFENKSKNQ